MRNDALIFFIYRPSIKRWRSNLLKTSLTRSHTVVLGTVSIFQVNLHGPLEAFISDLTPLLPLSGHLYTTHGTDNSALSI